MLIEFTRREVVSKFGVKIGEFGWILEDNKGMLSIAQLPGAGQPPVPGFTRKRCDRLMSASTQRTRSAHRPS